MNEQSRPDEPAKEPAAHDSARLRGPRRLLAAGSVGALLLAFGSSFAGLDGEAGLVIFLLLLALVAGICGIWVGGMLLLDDVRGNPTSLRRGLWTAGLFLLALACMTALSGLASSLGGGA